MYLVTPEIYKRLLDNADSREKMKIQDLNKNENECAVGNENGAFPNVPRTPNQDQDINMSVSYDDSDGNENQQSPINKANHQEQFQSQYKPSHSQLGSDSDDVFSSDFAKTKNPGLGSELEHAMNEMSRIRQAALQQHQQNVLHGIKKKITTPKSIATANRQIPLRQLVNASENKEKYQNQIFQKQFPVDIDSVDMEIDTDPPTPTPILTSQSNETHTHRDNDKYQCNKCGLVFSNNKLLINHNNDFHSHKINVLGRKKDTGVKKKTNTNDKTLKNWRKIMSENNVEITRKKNPVINPKPEQKTETQSQSELPNDNTHAVNNPHVNNTYGSLLSCKLCPASFNTQKAHDRHLKNIHNTDSNYKSEDIQGLKRKVNDTSGNIIEKGALKKKQLIHFFNCKLCSTNFKDKKNLDRHLKNIHKTDENYKYNLPQGMKRKNINTTDRSYVKKIKKNDNYMKWK